jgi:hypothetical protein
MLNEFNGMDGNGLGTLLVGDESPVGESTLVNWGLEITTIPEPTSETLLGCALAGGLSSCLGQGVKFSAKQNRS